MEKDLEKENEELKKQLEEKEKAEAKRERKETANKIINVILWIVMIAWMAMCLYDFYRVHTEKEPVFCLKKETTKYEDGNVDSCLGLGYKVYNYKRSSFRAIEFGPFWSKDRSTIDKAE